MGGGWDKMLINTFRKEEAPKGCWGLGRSHEFAEGYKLNMTEGAYLITFPL